MELKKQTLNPAVINHYNRLRLGLRYYSPEEIKAMTEDKKRSIIYDCNKFYSIVNALKQLKLTAIVNRIFNQTFPEAPKTQTLDILLRPVIDHNTVIDNRIKELYIPRDIVINELIKQKLIPNNLP